jgi:hypothetical protein
MGPFGWRHLSVTLCFLSALPAADFTTYIGDANDYRVAHVVADASGNTYSYSGTRPIRLPKVMREELSPPEPTESP